MKRTSGGGWCEIPATGRSRTSAVISLFIKRIESTHSCKWDQRKRSVRIQARTQSGETHLRYQWCVYLQAPVWTLMYSCLQYRPGRENKGLSILGYICPFYSLNSSTNRNTSDWLYTRLASIGFLTTVLKLHDALIAPLHGRLAVSS